MRAFLVLVFILMGSCIMAQNTVNHQVVLVISTQAKMTLAKNESQPTKGEFQSTAAFEANKKWTVHVTSRLTEGPEKTESYFFTKENALNKVLSSRTKTFRDIPSITFKENFSNLPLSTEKLYNVDFIYTLSSI